ncbi:MAG: hypothetical protein H6Q04_3205 [Acidobacteria bacterium]|nr:hypothetical protein [Acidobacteriota bacterium]
MFFLRIGIIVAKDHAAITNQCIRRGYRVSLKFGGERGTFMKILRIVTIMVLLVPVCGCVPIQSFYPLWDEQHAAFERCLVGDWVYADSDKEAELSFVKSEKEAYLATYTEKERRKGTTQKSCYEAKLVKLGEYLFIDFASDEDSIGERMEEEVFQPLFPMHFFARIEVNDDILKLALLDDDRLKRKISDEEIDLPILEKDGEVILTAETARIQQVLQQFAGGEDLWDEIMELHRQPK